MVLSFIWMKYFGCKMWFFFDWPISVYFIVISSRNQSTDLHWKSINWLLFDGNTGLKLFKVVVPLKVFPMCSNEITILLSRTCFLQTKNFRKALIWMQYVGSVCRDHKEIILKLGKYLSCRIKGSSPKFASNIKWT